MIQAEMVRSSKTPAVEEVKKEILEFCTCPRTKEEILNFIQVDLKPYNFKKYISRFIDDRYLQHTIPHNPRSTNQQYLTSKKGQSYLRAIAV
jgi:ATP-dependent DNA helicase RecG